MVMALEPPTNSPPPVESATARHNRIYTTLLIALALLCARDDQHLFHKSQSDDPASVAMDVSNDRVLVAAMVATLILRRIAPRGGRVAAMALNIVLLLVFPLGTTLGIYGLLKVDKGGPPAEA